MAEEKRVKVVLETTAETQGAIRDLSAVEAKARDAEKAITGAKEEARTLGGELKDMFKGGFFEGLKEFGAQVFVAGGTLYKTTNALTAAVKEFNKEGANAATVLDKILRSLPGVDELYAAGRALGSTSSAITGPRDRLEASRELARIHQGGTPITEAFESGRESLQRQRLELVFRANSAEAEAARVRGMNTVPGIVGGGILPTALDAEAAMTNDIRGRRSRLQREVLDAGEFRNLGQDKVTQLESEMRVLEKWRDRAKDRFKDPLTVRLQDTPESEAIRKYFPNRDPKEFMTREVRGKDEQRQAFEEMVAAEEELAKKRGELMAATERLHKSTVEWRTKENELAKIGLELSKSELEAKQKRLGVVEAELAKTQSTAKQWGMMGAGDRMGIAKIMEKLRKGGWASLQADEREALINVGITAPEAEKAAKADAMADPVYQRLAGQIGQRPVADIEAERARLVGEISKIDIQLRIDTATTEANFARTMQTSFDDFAKQMGEHLKKAMFHAIERLQQELLDKTIQGSGD
jgi:uncharacterized protein YecE (DUF72 family)